MPSTRTNGQSCATKPATSSVWSDLPKRLATICIGFPLLWKALQYPLLAHIFFIGVHGLSVWEFTALEPAGNATTAKTKQDWRQRFGFCLVSMFLASTSITSASASFSTLLFLFLLVIASGIFVILHRLHWITGLFCLTVPFRGWIQLQGRNEGDAFANTISLLLIVWNVDTGALILGRVASSLRSSNYGFWFPIWPVPVWIHMISPKKSMEGFVGGLLGGIWTSVQWISWMTKWAFSPDTISPAFESLWITSSWQQRMLQGLALSFLAILGDLVESSIKRQSQTKDSGSILPGHGGVLDRFDSSLLAVLFYHLLLEMDSQ